MDGRDDDGNTGQAIVKDSAHRERERERWGSGPMGLQDQCSSMRRREWEEVERGRDGGGLQGFASSAGGRLDASVNSCFDQVATTRSSK